MNCTQKVAQAEVNVEDLKEAPTEQRSRQSNAEVHHLRGLDCGLPGVGVVRRFVVADWLVHRQEEGAVGCHGPTAPRLHLLLAFLQGIELVKLTS